jgi:hypothetical protein
MRRSWVLAALLAVGCKHGPSEDDCKQLLDHLVELEFKKAGVQSGSNANVKADLEKARETIGEQKAPEFMEQCSKKMAKSRVNCAITAPTLEEVQKCDSDGK